MFCRMGDEGEMDCTLVVKDERNKEEDSGRSKVGVAEIKAAMM